MLLHTYDKEEVSHQGSTYTGKFGPHSGPKIDSLDRFFNGPAIGHERVGRQIIKS